MGTIAITKNLPGTPEVLFETITRPSTWDQWFSIHRDFVGEPPEKLSTGAELVSKVTLLGMNGEVRWSVREFDRPHRLVLRGKAMAGVKCEFTYLLRAIDTGTEITAGGDFSGPLITGVLATTLEKHGLEQLIVTLDRLADLAARG
ncbi:SRPBCC family protein [Nocardia sp. NPDC058058]|uniref:type II toxin-antitoxin system Rv0910 family toxin n=1 Tax=Nocardia sp. NPDC058058 TaxID=3346317 RepID=UPI0036D8CB22